MILTINSINSYIQEMFSFFVEMHFFTRMALLGKGAICYNIKIRMSKAHRGGGRFWKTIKINFT